MQEQIFSNPLPPGPPFLFISMLCCSASMLMDISSSFTFRDVSDVIVLVFQLTTMAIGGYAGWLSIKYTKKRMAKEE